MKAMTKPLIAQCAVRQGRVDLDVAQRGTPLRFQRFRPKQAVRSGCTCRTHSVPLRMLLCAPLVRRVRSPCLSARKYDFARVAIVSIPRRATR